MAKYMKTEQGYIDIPNFALEPFKPAGKSYLTFSSSNSFTLKRSFGTKTWDGTIEYFASDRTWTVWDGKTVLSSVYDDGEYFLYLRGTKNTIITGDAIGFRWILHGSNIACIGNIENLLDYTIVASGNHPTMANHCYSYMFQGCTALTQAPALPATTMAGYCYEYMFYNCTSLKLSSTKTDDYMQEYRIPSSGDGMMATGAMKNMFTSTGGIFTGTPAINTTYYLSSDNMIVRETDIATLNGYVGSMIDTAEYIIPSSTSGRLDSASSSSDFFFKVLRNAVSTDFQPFSCTILPLAMNSVLEHRAEIHVSCKTYFGAVAHSSRWVISARISRSPWGSPSSVAFAISTVGIMAW